MMVKFYFSIAERAVKCARDGDFDPLIDYLSYPNAPIEGEMRQLLVEIVKGSKLLTRHRPRSTTATLDGLKETADQVRMLMAGGLRKTKAVQEVARERKRSPSHVWKALRIISPDESAT